MGNSIGGRPKKAKVMKIDGQIFKLKTPIRAFEVVKDYPGHVLLESKSVKLFGIRAKPLEPEESLEPNKIYFLVELPKLPEPEEEEKVVRRTLRSGVNMTAKDRLECLMLSRRSASDVSLVRPDSGGGKLVGSGSVRVKMRLPKAEVDKLMGESRDEVEAAQRIVDLYLQRSTGASEIDRRRLGRRGEENQRVVFGA